MRHLTRPFSGQPGRSPAADQPWPPAAADHRRRAAHRRVPRGDRAAVRARLRRADPSTTARRCRSRCSSTRPSAPGDCPTGTASTGAATPRMSDGADVGLDLTGGWYDAGDHVKFGLPMAVSATMLAWGAVEYRDGYTDSGQLTAPAQQPALGQRLLHQGAPVRQRALWADRRRRHRPRLVGTGRGHADGAAAYKIDATCGGSDLAGRPPRRWPPRPSCSGPPTPTYANTLLTHAKQLYAFADTFRRKYSDCITDAHGYYNRGAATTTSWSGARSGSTAPPTKPPTWPRPRADYANLCTEQQTTIKSYKWTHAWDDKSYGATCCWPSSPASSSTSTTPTAGSTTGRSASTGSGSRTRRAARPCSTVGLAALRRQHLVRRAGLRDWITDATLKARYHDFARPADQLRARRQPAQLQLRDRLRRQLRRSNPHHRTAHGSWTDSSPSRPRPGTSCTARWSAARVAQRRLHRRPRRLHDERGRHRLQRRLHLRARPAVPASTAARPLANFPVAETPDGDEIRRGRVNAPAAASPRSRRWSTTSRRCRRGR